MNTSGTNGSNCAETVPNPLLVARNQVGAETPIGHGLSNVNEQNLYRPLYVVPAWATHPTQTLGARMAWQADRLATLSFAKGDRE